MLFKDFKIYFICSFIAITALNLALMFPAMAYEEGMTQSKGAEIAYHIVAINLFSLSFWSGLLNFFDIVDVIMAIATTAFIVSVVMIVVLRGVYWFKKEIKSKSY